MRSPSKVYYGWANLAIAALAMVGTLPGRTQGLGLITEPLLKDLHLDRVTYATVNLWATLIGAAFCLPYGKLIDRFGSRIVMTFIALALGATVLTMRSMESLAAIFITITLTRGFGQSALSVASLALVGKWFAKRLNFAMGIYSLLVGVGFILAFPSVGAAVLKFGWRAAWSGVGVFLVLALAPLAWIFVRDVPGKEELETEPFFASDLTIWEALRTPAFWIFALSSSIFGLVYSGISLFNESILAERGFDATVYHTVLVVSTMLGLLANFGGGWLAAKWSIQRVAGIGMAVLAVSLFALPLVKTYAHVMMYGIAMGIAGGVLTVVFFSVWGQAFGRTHLGRIQGAAQMMTVFASAVGPLLLAETLRQTGSYDVVFNGLGVIVVFLGIASWYCPMP
ncbi:MAG: MFS transporter, partial [Acidobacteriia bacterium]|nr:MFS transporter [Terriglobia bacterium]